MKTRAITGFFFVLAMLSSVLFSAQLFYWFYFVLVGLSLWEFYSLFQESDYAPSMVRGLGLGLMLYLYFHPAIFGSKAFYVLLVFVYLMFVQELFRPAHKAPFVNIALTLLGVVYVAVPYLCFYKLAFTGGEFAYSIPLGFLLMLWSSDTGAYLTGMSFGKHKLFERHSPKKTWEGFFGGILMALITAFVLSFYFPDLSRVQWLLMGGIIASVGTLGDLVESMLKRSLNVKDSGSILPGHGGVLDRFDGLLISAPVVYAFLKIFS